jgi:hypothetical protein
MMSLFMIGCGSDPDTSAAGGPGPSTSSFNPPAAPEGYTRLTAKTVYDVKPGADVTYCQYIMAPFDRDMDILDVGGYQSGFGHHAVAFSYPDDGTQELGTSVQCMGTEFNVDVPNSGAPASRGANLGGTFLGGIGGEGGEGGQLPDGVAFRLKQGSGIMLNVHYLNTGDQAIDGDAVVDVKFAEIDPSRRIAAMFLNLNAGFNLAPATRTDSSIDCIAKSDVQILMMANHMHEYGTRVTTEVVRADTGAVEVMKHDPEWTYEMQFNVEYSTWPLEQPFVLRTGDTIRTSCQWSNPTSESIALATTPRPPPVFKATGFRGSEAEPVRALVNRSRLVARHQRGRGRRDRLHRGTFGRHLRQRWRSCARRRWRLRCSGASSGRKCRRVGERRRNQHRRDQHERSEWNRQQRYGRNRRLGQRRLGGRRRRP